MPVSEKRARFVQGIESQLKVAKVEKKSEISDIRNIIKRDTGKGIEIDKGRGMRDAHGSKASGVAEKLGFSGTSKPAGGFDSEARNIKDIITSRPVSDNKTEEIFASISRLEERIDMLEAQMKRHFGNSKLVETEINRLVADRWENLSKETDECLTRMMCEMQDLRDIVIGLRSTVRAIDK